MRTFLACRKGNVAVIFGLSLFPVLGLMAAALDYGRLASFREFSRRVSDEVALAVALADDAQTRASIVEGGVKQLTAQYPSSVLTDLKVDGTWTDNANYRLAITGTLSMSMLGAVPGAPNSAASQVVSVVNRTPPKYKTLPPTSTLLSPEAADYNEIAIYCYDSRRTGDKDGGRRLITPIADNATPPSDYSKAKIPECKEGETASYMNRNVRNARSDPKKWDGKNGEVYEYYTDATIDENTGAVTNKMKAYKVDKKSSTPVSIASTPMLETILCDTKEQCRPKSEGGILPNNNETGRTPKTATGGCAEGKYLYYGWEDRPGGDQDYDDIRFVVECPKKVMISDKQVRIVQ